MPLSYEIDRERRLVITTALETVTGSEALVFQGRLGSDDRFNAEFSHLVDLTRLTSVDIDVATMTELAARPVHANSRRAFVVGLNRLAYSMSRMFIALTRVTGEEQMRVFEDRNEALQWLGILGNR